MKLLSVFLMGGALLLALPLASVAQTSAGVTIGAATAADASAVLDITSVDKGALLPRLSASARLGIASPAPSLLVYQTDSPTTGLGAGTAAGFWYNSGTAAAPAWQRLTDSGSAAPTNGLNAVVRTTAEAAGANCNTGGIKFEAGTDSNGNGTLDTGEVNAALTRYICTGAQGAQGIQGATGPSGTNGLNAAVRTTAEAAGANCAAGGNKLEFGTDANNNGVLDAGEVNAALTRYVCNGAQGPVGPTGATGAQGTAGTLGVYGDGSAGVLLISSNTDWTTTPPASFNFQYTSITVNGGTTLTVPSGTVLRCSGNVNLIGSITVAPGALSNVSLASTGLAASPASDPYAGSGVAAVTAANLPTSSPWGGGSGWRNVNCIGGDGGGSFALLAQGFFTVTPSCTIRANGSSSVNPQTAGVGITGGGGGGGGVITLVSKTGLDVRGSLQANGGNGSAGFDGNGGNAEGGGGGGGGGVVRVLAAALSVAPGTVQVNGGSAGANAGASATINAGGGGGACGGSGGSGGSTTTTAAAGSTGRTVITTVANPENLLN